jgi:hypothetical protein
MNRTTQRSKSAPRKGQFVVVVEHAATLLSVHGKNRTQAYEALNRKQRTLTAPNGAAVRWYGSDGHLYQDIHLSFDDPFELTPEQAASEAALRYQEERELQ